METIRRSELLTELQVLLHSVQGKHKQTLPFGLIQTYILKTSLLCR